MKKRHRRYFDRIIPELHCRILLSRKSCATLLVFFWGLISFSAGIAADDISVRLSADKNVCALNETITLTVRVIGSRSSGHPRLLNADGIQILSRGNSTQVRMVNGKTVIAGAYTYEVMPMKTGKLTIGPAVVRVNGKDRKTGPLTLTVREKNAAGRGSSKETKDTEAEKQLSRDHAFLTVDFPAESFYVNEPFTVTVRFSIDEKIARYLRDISFPVLDVQNFTVRNPEQDKRIRAERKMKGDRIYRVWTFRRILIPVAAGEQALSAHLETLMLIPDQNNRRSADPFFDDPFFRDFFGQYEQKKIMIRSGKETVVVRTFPDQEKPGTFKGAFGVFGMTAKVSGKKVRVGEPVTLTVTITGTGNIESVTPPVLSGKENFKVFPEPPDTEKDPSDPLAGKKIYTFTIVPENTDVTETPVCEFSFYNPEKKTYEVLRSRSFPLNVLPAEESGGIFAAGRKNNGQQNVEVLREDIVPVKKLSSGVPFHQSLSVLSLRVTLPVFLLPLLFAAGARMAAGHRQRISADPSYVRKRNALRTARERIRTAREQQDKGNLRECTAMLNDAVCGFAADRRDLPSGSVHGNGLIREIRDVGATPEVIDAATEWNHKLEHMRFAGEPTESQTAGLILETEQLLKMLRGVFR